MPSTSSAVESPPQDTQPRRRGLWLLLLLVPVAALWGWGLYSDHARANATPDPSLPLQLTLRAGALTNATVSLGGQPLTLPWTVNVDALKPGQFEVAPDDWRGDGGWTGLPREGWSFGVRPGATPDEALVIAERKGSSARLLRVRASVPEGTALAWAEGFRGGRPETASAAAAGPAWELTLVPADRPR